VRILNAEAFLPEGPAFLGGKLYYAEFGADRVSVWDGSRNAVFWHQTGSGASAIVPLGPGFAVMCYSSGQVMLLSEDARLERIVDYDGSGAPLIGPNDAVADAHGGFYFTTSGPWAAEPIIGKVHYLRAAGRLELVADDLHYANGIALSGDGGVLYVCESEANRVVAFTVGPRGSLSDRRLFVRMRSLGQPDDAYPDGIKLGPDGRLYVGLYSSGRVLVVDPSGTLVRTIDVPCSAAPNVAFSPDGGTLFVMATDEPHTPPYRGKVLAISL
jgi:gluconolactonase